MAKIQNKPHLTNFIKQNYIWILMIVTMSCIHLLYMYLIGARKQDLVYAAVLDAILLLITVLVGFFRYSSKVKALSNALKRPVEEQAQLPEATDDVEILYHRLLENQSIARSESESSAAIRRIRRFCFLGSLPFPLPLPPEPPLLLPFPPELLLYWLN